MPPRHGKSTLSSNVFPAWFLGRWPDKRVILSSYEADFAATWGRKARGLLEEWGGPIFGVGLNPRSNAADRWDLAGHAGGMTTAGVGGPLTGKGADLFIIDDPVKNSEDAMSATKRAKAWDWYQSTALSRLEPGGAMVLIQTRWHVEDLAGLVLREAEDSGEKWEIVCMPAVATGENDPLGRSVGEPLWPERWPLRELEQKKKDPYWWECLYQQNPRPEGGTEWPVSYFDGPGFWFEDWPPLEKLPLRILSLDPSKGTDAKTGDYQALVKYARDANGVEYVEADMGRRPMTAATSADGKRITEGMIENLVDEVVKFQPHGLALEVNQFQVLLVIPLLAELKRRGVEVPIFEINNMDFKVMRIRRLGPPLSQRKMRFKAKSPGTKILVEQMKQFPVGTFDDGPDSLEQARRLGIKLHNEGR